MLYLAYHKKNYGYNSNKLVMLKGKLLFMIVCVKGC